MDTEQLIPILQASVAPVILISGVGLLLLSMTNRYGRVIDRARALARENAGGAANASRASLVEQADVIWRRAKLLRASIVLATFSIFCVALTVGVIFAEQISGLHLPVLILLPFALSLVALALSLVLFLRDITLSLTAVRHELATVLPSL